MQECETAGKTAMLLADKHSVLGIIAVADTVKETSKEAVDQLKSMGIAVYMITGDNKRTAQAIAESVGITNVLAEVLPEEKANEVKKLQGEGKKVAMVGDGINDSPALAQAELGIAMGSGTDIAMETGGIVLVRNDLRDVVTAIKLSRATVTKIKQNMFFALFYNIIGIPIAARLFMDFGVVLRPELAGLAMAFSSVSVVTNSLLLKGFHPTKRNWISDIAPFVMVIGFTALFFAFAKISSAEPAVNPDPNHTHADFAVFIDGNRIDFSQEKYMSTDTDPRHPYTHVHDGNGNVMHRHKPGITIGDFFSSLNISLSADCFVLDTGERYCNDESKQLKMFVNEQEVPVDPAYVFQDLDQILLTYGASDTEYYQQLRMLSNDACRYSQTCPERGSPPKENCVSDPTVPCVAP